MNLTKPIVLAASLAVLAGCEHNVQDTSALEAGIAEVKSGDFGTCYQNIHAAALALERAEKGLAHIQKVDNIHTEGTYPAAMQAVEDARAARAAAPLTTQCGDGGKGQEGEQAAARRARATAAASDDGAAQGSPAQVVEQCGLCHAQRHGRLAEQPTARGGACPPTASRALER